MSRARRVALAAMLGVAATVYWLVVRPSHRQWGATHGEVHERLPGDDIVAEPAETVTHAITIDAPASEVWPWLVQIGQGRGGFYSYDFLENLVGADIHNVDRVVPEYQDLAVGDVVRLAPPDYPVQSPLSVPTVAVLEAERALVLESADEPPSYSWAFVLEPLEESTTRFVGRMRSRPPESVASWLASRLFWEPAHFVMERKMLLGVKERVENPPGHVDVPARPFA